MLCRQEALGQPFHAGELRDCAFNTRWRSAITRNFGDDISVPTRAPWHDAAGARVRGTRVGEMGTEPELSALPVAPTAQSLSEWLVTAHGAAIATIEITQVRELLANLFGYHIVQIGDPSLPNLIDHSRIAHQVRIGCTAELGHVDLCAVPGALPLAPNSVDVVVLPHALEFAANPHDVLREAERVLIGEGHLLIVGFNPWSSFGVWRRAIGWRGAAPWSGRFLSLTRLHDWLGLLGFEVERVVRASFRPPLAHAQWHQRMEFLERMGGHFWPLLGNVYVVLARKRVALFTPVRERWRKRRRLATGSVVEPTARQRPCE